MSGQRISKRQVDESAAGDPNRGKNDYTSCCRVARDGPTLKPNFAAIIASGLSYATCIRAAASVLYINIVTVSGPTPRGTGVIADATSLAAAKSTSPTTPASVRL